MWPGQGTRYLLKVAYQMLGRNSGHSSCALLQLELNQARVLAVGYQSCVSFSFCWGENNSVVRSYLLCMHTKHLSCTDIKQGNCYIAMQRHFLTKWTQCSKHQQLLMTSSDAQLWQSAFKHAYKHNLTFWKLRPCFSAYRSMNLINLSHSKALRMKCLASTLSGLPLRNLALTSTVEISPSSSIMYKPVMSPSSSEDSNTDGAPKTKVAVPDEPSLDLVSFTSGTSGSSTPLMN